MEQVNKRSIVKHLQKLTWKNTSGYKGVTFSKRKKKWVAQIIKDQKFYWLGEFETPEDAALAYNMKAKELYKEHAYQNKVVTS